MDRLGSKPEESLGFGFLAGCPSDRSVDGTCATHLRPDLLRRACCQRDYQLLVVGAVLGTAANSHQETFTASGVRRLNAGTIASMLHHRHNSSPRYRQLEMDCGSWRSPRTACDPHQDADHAMQVSRRTGSLLAPAFVSGGPQNAVFVALVLPVWAQARRAACFASGQADSL